MSCSTGRFTEWLNRDSPSVVGDFETLADFVSMGQACPHPLDIQCRTSAGQVDWTQTGEIVTCSPTVGGVCRNADQPDLACQDYEVRFLCP